MTPFFFAPNIFVISVGKTENDPDIEKNIRHNHVNAHIITNVDDTLFK